MPMNTILQSEVFTNWLHSLKDQAGKFAIIARLRRAELGNFGDCKTLGPGLAEMRVHAGPGYRIYYTQEDNTIYIVLCGGAKSTQASDIARARQMIAERRQV